MRDKILEEEYREMVYDCEIEFRNGPAGWQMANHEEDQMIARVDCKRKVKEILLGVSDERISGEFWWLVRLLFAGPKELCEAIKSRHHNAGVSKCKIRDLMQLLGYDRRRIESALDKMFRKEVGEEKKFLSNNDIMKERRATWLRKRRKKDSPT